MMRSKDNSKKTKKNKKNVVQDSEEMKEDSDEQPELSEIEILAKRIQDEAPERGYQSKAEPELFFSNYPLSAATLKGLSIAKLENPTDIQAASIPHALAGRDIFGIAKTGQGKTLAFLIPMLEKLYHARWDHHDGLGAIIISPTRELAYQIFQVLRVVGKHHQYSAGLITGGMKEFEMEQERIVRMNIIVATPGRLLQHFEQTTGFDASQLEMLVLDEADRILDMGFRDQLDSLLEYLPTSRQTLLFSATQTKSVKDLARLSMKDPEYLAVHSKEEFSTPKQLIQNYTVCKLEDKLDVLFSFIKAHLHSKILVFFSTCSQVRFVFECFRGLQPGIVLTALHGKIKQERRTYIYTDFMKRKAVCMFATDIAARGLDFPEVDWVIQVDAPEDADMYIHRVGRTARYNATGRALLFLLAEEEKAVLTELQSSNVPISKLTVNTKFKVSVSSRAAALLASRPETKELAKKAFTSYLRSLQLLSHQRVDVSSLPVAAFATSLGLPFTPPLPFLHTESEEAVNEEREQIRAKKNVNRALDKLKRQIKEAKDEKKRKRLESMNARNEDQPRESEEEDDNDEENDDLFEVKQSSMLLENNDDDEDLEPTNLSKLSRSQRKKLLASKIKIKTDGELAIMKAAGSKKIVFNDDDDDDEGREEEVDYGKSSVEAHIAAVKARLDASRMEDDLKDKDRIRNVHKLRRLREKSARNDDDEAEGVQLTSYEPDERSDTNTDSDRESDDQDDYDEDDEEPPEPVNKRIKFQKESDEERILRMFG